jgi:CopA family copper-resistance protein
LARHHFAGQHGRRAGPELDGIGRGETYHYRFTLHQGGTYWYHSHSGSRNAGLYGPIVIDPLEPEPFSFDRDYVVMLSDWTDLDPTALFDRLKKMPGHDNYYKRTVGDFARDVKRNGLSATLEDRKMWGVMRMTPTDLSDVNANTYTYLMNGTTSLGNWTGLFRSGEKVRLRFINGSAMTYFDVRIPGLKMTVVAADGLYVHPVSVDEFRIAVAETFDVIVSLRAGRIHHLCPRLRSHRLRQRHARCARRITRAFRLWIPGRC